MTSVKSITLPKSASHPDIMDAIRRAAEIAHDSAVQHISITIHITEKAYYTIDAAAD